MDISVNRGTRDELATPCFVIYGQVDELTELAEVCAEFLDGRLFEDEESGEPYTTADQITIDLCRQIIDANQKAVTV